jgi:DNA-binding helix-hairpin-helix protein with protein kinase domain
MALNKGDFLNGEFGTNYTVEKPLGKGGQGWVYQVMDPKTHRFAVKWYTLNQAQDAQRNAIRELCRSGPPQGKAGERFVWPRDVVTKTGDQSFGYVMPLIDTNRFCDHLALLSGKRRDPTWATLCEITFQTANSYRQLHLHGKCYRDISHGNVMFDPQTGEVKICDNDNVGADGNTVAQVVGTAEYMAPEVTLRQAGPSTRTDLHSLAVLLFKFWMWWHPLHGIQEGKIRSLDDAAYRLLYGENPVFIFDPNNKSNAAIDTEEYATVRDRWALCPPVLRSLFIKAFTVGLRDPGQRVTEGEWERAAISALDSIYSCQCNAQNALEFVSEPSRCWHCRKLLPRLVWLRLRSAAGDRLVPLRGGFVLKRRHLTGGVDDDGESIGKLVQNPADPMIWGLQNLGKMSWQVKATDGTNFDVPPQKSVPLSEKFEVVFSNTAKGMFVIPK